MAVSRSDFFLTLVPFQVCGGDLPYVSPDSLEKRHHFNFKEALYTFSSTKKMGGQEFCDRYQAQLEKELEEMWQSFCKHNEVKTCRITSVLEVWKVSQLSVVFCLQSKNLFSAFRTPAVLFVLVCFLYVLSGVLLFIGLSTFALVCDCTMGVVMMSMLTWAFIRYSGRYRHLGGAIDQAAGVVLEQVSVLGEGKYSCS